MEKKKKKKKNGKVLAAFLWDANVPKPFAGSAKKAAFFLSFRSLSSSSSSPSSSAGAPGAEEVVARSLAELESTGKIRDAT